MSDGETKRAILEIIKIEARKSIGDKGAVKLEFTAKEGDKEHKFATFKKNLFETIEAAQGKKLDCEYTLATRQVGDVTYTDRNVQQIFVAGQPVASKEIGGRPGGQWGRTPEQQAVERASIERQTALKEAVHYYEVRAYKDTDMSPADVIAIAREFAAFLSVQEVKAEAKKPEPEKAEPPKVQGMKDLTPNQFKDATVKAGLLLEMIPDYAGKTANDWVKGGGRLDDLLRLIQDKAAEMAK